MPRAHHTKIFQTQASIASGASWETVIATILRPSTWPQWQAEIVSTEGPERVEEGAVVDGAARLLGFDVTGRSIATNVQEDVFEEDVIVGVRMRVTYRVMPREGGSLISHRMDADLPAGIAGSVLSLLLRWRLKKMQVRLLDRLRVQAEEASR